MSREFHIDENVSEKQLNHQSTSLVIPHITRVKIHNSMYHKVNLDTASLRGNSMIQLTKTMVRDLGNCRGGARQMPIVCGGVEFKCLLMKLIYIKPKWDQLLVILQKGNEKSSKFDNKYLVVLILLYLRIQYYFLPRRSRKGRISSVRDFGKQDRVSSDHLQDLMKIYIGDYRKVKSMGLCADCWAQPGTQNVEVLHIDEIVDWLCTQKQIWGIPLGQCQWSNIYEDDESSDTESSDTESSDIRSSDDENNGSDS
ncbi:LANO_0A04016g1_1 [Lachancea nothofagi CBS 11611]|uniref:Pre-mRNA-splicing factor 38 n=1 Tax=Lachancea nothofagi CBS 11611 TaxID=1266666 RepID=A0A1G4IQJ1_9SACH|nr:LANO_0A04016g1_1 [Lachancea nothofagi CBS 11611]